MGKEGSKDTLWPMMAAHHLWVWTPTLKRKICHLITVLHTPCLDQNWNIWKRKFGSNWGLWTWVHPHTNKLNQQVSDSVPETQWQQTSFTHLHSTMAASSLPTFQILLTLFLLPTVIQIHMEKWFLAKKNSNFTLLTVVQICHNPHQISFQLLI